MFSIQVQCLETGWYHYDSLLSGGTAVYGTYSNSKKCPVKISIKQNVMIFNNFGHLTERTVHCNDLSDFIDGNITVILGFTWAALLKQVGTGATKLALWNTVWSTVLEQCQYTMSENLGISPSAAHNISSKEWYGWKQTWNTHDLWSLWWGR